MAVVGLSKEGKKFFFIKAFTRVLLPAENSPKKATFTFICSSFKASNFSAIELIPCFSAMVEMSCLLLIFAEGATVDSIFLFFGLKSLFFYFGYTKLLNLFS